MNLNIDRSSDLTGNMTIQWVMVTTVLVQPSFKNGDSIDMGAGTIVLA